MRHIARREGGGD